MSKDHSFKRYIDQLEKSDPLPGRLAMFDLDRTLIAGYSFHAFIFERARQGLVTTRGLAGHLRQFVEYGLQRIEFEQLLQQVAEDLQGVETAEVMDFAREVFKKHLQASLYREARQLVEAHRRLGHRLVMVTSATRFQAQPVAEFLGFDDVFCTELGARGGRLTGRLRGKPCFGEGKASAGRRVARRNGQALRNAWFYTDSADDLALLDIVGKPVVVNAQPRLATLALERAWPTFTFHSRRALNVEGAIRSGMVCQGLIGSAVAGAATYARTLSPVQARNRMTSMLGDMCSAFAGLDLEVDGWSFLEAARPAVFIFNHQSYMDAVILAQLLRGDVTAFCKQELWNNPIIGPYMRASGAIFVDRQNPAAARAHMRSAADVIRAGRSVAIAPEGTRSSTEALGPFERGAFVLARKMAVPIVPLVLHNSGDILPKGKFCINPATVRVTVLPPANLHDCSRQDFKARIGTLEQDYRHTLAG